MYIEYSSLCYSLGLCQLTILYMVMRTSVGAQSLNYARLSATPTFVGTLLLGNIAC